MAIGVKSILWLVLLPVFVASGADFPHAEITGPHADIDVDDRRPSDVQLAAQVFELGVEIINDDSDMVELVEVQGCDARFFIGRPA